MNIASDSLLLVLENTVYWDGQYVLDRTWGWEYQCEFCFSIRAHVGDLVVVELYDCMETRVARFFLLNENEASAATEIADAYRYDLRNATATISFL